MRQQTSVHSTIDLPKSYCASLLLALKLSNWTIVFFFPNTSKKQKQNQTYTLWHQPSHMAPPIPLIWSGTCYFFWIRTLLTLWPSYNCQCLSSATTMNFLISLSNLIILQCIINISYLISLIL